MPSELNVYLLPTLTTPDSLRGQVVVVIDVLRASTTIIAALAQGARQVIPCLEVADAREIARRFAREECVLGGEREGLKIEGFDLGNSPSEYTGESVADKSVIFTTTNGTRALLQCRMAREVLIGAFVNLSAVAAQLAHAERAALLCAGTRGEITREDILCAGALADRALNGYEASGQTVRLNDQARIAVDVWHSAMRHNRGGGTNAPAIDRRALIRELQNSQGGRNLTAIGLADDIRDGADVDRFSLIPRFDPAQGIIQAASECR